MAQLHFVTVGELKAYLKANDFADDARLILLLTDATGKPVRAVFPAQLDRAKGTQASDALVMVTPAAEVASA